MKRAGIGLIVVFCLIVILVAGRIIDRSWVTPFEKSAAVNALHGIQAVRDFGGLDNEAYQAQVVKAQQAVELCKKKAVTEQDSRVANGVEMLLGAAQADMKFWQLPDSDPKKMYLLQVRKNGAEESDEILEQELGIKKN